MDSELSRRIGFASAEFYKLWQVWGHANITRAHKLKLFQSFVLSKLSYGLGTTSLVKVQQRRLDGFHAKCLRRILNVSAAYISRVSRRNVFARAGVTPASEQVMQRQLSLFRRVGKSEAGSVLRRNTLTGSTANPIIGSYVRRVGRPRLDWSTQVRNEAVRRSGSILRMEHALLDASVGADQRWTRMMRAVPRPV